MNPSQEFDLAVIGGGPGGYVCAIRAAQLGLATALIEKRAFIGGTCLNEGCIPSKALLYSSKLFETAKTSFEKHGILLSDLKLDLAAMMKRKQDIVQRLRKGTEQLLKANKVQVFQADAHFKTSNEICLKKTNCEETLKAKNFVIASGSLPVELPFLPFDGKKVISSAAALTLNEVPEKFLVIGAGVIGLEMASIWSRLGSQVHIIELMPRAVPEMDAQISKTLERSLKKQGIKFSFNTKVSNYESTNNGITLFATNDRNENISFEGNVCLVATGRAPNSKDLNIEKLEIAKDKKGRIQVNKNWQTSINNIYAIGDVITGPMLAHKAEEEGTAVAEILAGHNISLTNNSIPHVVYTEPEAASVGFAEEYLKDNNIEYSVGSFPFLANGRALCSDSTDGLAKILASKTDNKILGIHIVGPEASELIAVASVIIKKEGTINDLATSVWAHPTLSEALKEASHAIEHRAIHMLPKRSK